MGLNDTPSAERVHIGFFGRRNAGKSSLVNAVTGQDLSVVSPVEGTTTDPVRKAMELLPLGPVVIIDTPGFDDEGSWASCGCAAPGRPSSGPTAPCWWWTPKGASPGRTGSCWTCSGPGSCPISSRGTSATSPPPAPPSSGWASARPPARERHATTSAVQAAQSAEARPKGLLAPPLLSRCLIVAP